MNKIIDNYKSSICELINTIDACKIVDIIDILGDSRKNNKKIFIFGNGGSATTANHFVCDFGKNAIKGDIGRFKIISLCDNLATITAYGNDFGYEKIFEERLKNLMEDEDIIIAISASGNSKNVINAVKYASQRKGYIISMTGFDGGELKKLSDLNININSNVIEQVEDLHLMIEHIIVYFYKNSNILDA
jgi:D-sedoheptulose 7-phosphate isomerase